MKMMQAEQFTREYEYDSYKKETKKRDKKFREDRRGKRNRWQDKIEF